MTKTQAVQEHRRRGANREDARAAVDAAAAAFPHWSRTPAAERERLLNAAADLLDERAPAIAQTLVEECGGSSR